MLGQGGESCSLGLGVTPGSATCYPPMGLYSSGFSRETEPKCCVSSGCHKKMPQTRWLKQQKSVSHSSGGWKSKFRVPAWSDSGESPALKTSLTLITSPNPHLLIPSHWGLGLQCVDVRGHIWSATMYIKRFITRNCLTQLWRLANPNLRCVSRLETQQS